MTNIIINETEIDPMDLCVLLLVKKMCIEEKILLIGIECGENILWKVLLLMTNDYCVMVMNN